MSGKGKKLALALAFVLGLVACSSKYDEQSLRLDLIKIQDKLDNSGDIRLRMLAAGVFDESIRLIKAGETEELLRRNMSKLAGNGEVDKESIASYLDILGDYAVESRYPILADATGKIKQAILEGREADLIRALSYLDEN